MKNEKEEMKYICKINRNGEHIKSRSGKCIFRIARARYRFLKIHGKTKSWKHKMK